MIGYTNRSRHGPKALFFFWTGHEDFRDNYQDYLDPADERALSRLEKESAGAQHKSGDMIHHKPVDIGAKPRLEAAPVRGNDDPPPDDDTTKAGQLDEKRATSANKEPKQAPKQAPAGDNNNKVKGSDADKEGASGATFGFGLGNLFGAGDDPFGGFVGPEDVETFGVGGLQDEPHRLRRIGNDGGQGIKQTVANFRHGDARLAALQPGAPVSSSGPEKAKLLSKGHTVARAKNRRYLNYKLPPDEQAYNWDPSKRTNIDVKKRLYVLRIFHAEGLGSVPGFAKIFNIDPKKFSPRIIVDTVPPDQRGIHREEQRLPATLTNTALFRIRDTPRLLTIRDPRPRMLPRTGEAKKRKTVVNPISSFLESEAMLRSCLMPRPDFFNTDKDNQPGSGFLNFLTFSDVEALPGPRSDWIFQYEEKAAQQAHKARSMKGPDARPDFTEDAKKSQWNVKQSEGHRS